jgi:hypothetical protein
MLPLVIFRYSLFIIIIPKNFFECRIVSIVVCPDRERTEKDCPRGRYQYVCVKGNSQLRNLWDKSHRFIRSLFLPSYIENLLKRISVMNCHMSYPKSWFSFDHYSFPNGFFVILCDII